MPHPRMVKLFETLDAEFMCVTFEDIRLESLHSDILPPDTDVRTRLSRRITLNIPIVSSAMDTVTEARMAIAMAEAGGIGIIHRGMSPEEQARKVWRVKNQRHGRIATPTTVSPDAVVRDVLNMLEQNKRSFRTLPVVNDFGDVDGLVTGNDFDFCIDPGARMNDIMTFQKDLVTAPKETTPEEAYRVMLKTKKKVLLLLDDGKLSGMYLFSDLKDIFKKPSEFMRNTDANKQLCVAAAVGSGDNAFERAELLAANQCDAFQIDTAHGDTKTGIATIRELKRRYPHIDVIAGNVSNGESARRLADAGADAVAVGQGPGSICTTRIVAGIGKPQVSAVYESVRALEGYDVPVIADGGVGNSGDMVIALAVGASGLIIGRLLAGTDESPGEKIEKPDGRIVKYYRGMGSVAVMRKSADLAAKYGQGALTVGKLVPEGIEGEVPYKGPVAESLYQFVGGIRSGMGYNGAHTIAELQEKAIPFRMSSAGLRESHPHDLLHITAAPNYSR
ncbi:IMP dehydrogenase [Candidatus Kaiserbacteria bacterium]|nr:IMP dehydrogenase [Candidatus Kaiserbacteria bacterium]